jgi:hypothetical protein
LPEEISAVFVAEELSFEPHPLKAAKAAPAPTSLIKSRRSILFEISSISGFSCAWGKINIEK